MPYRLAWNALRVSGRSRKPWQALPLQACPVRLGVMVETCTAAPCLKRGGTADCIPLHPALNCHMLDTYAAVRLWPCGTRSGHCRSQAPSIPLIPAASRSQRVLACFHLCLVLQWVTARPTADLWRLSWQQRLPARAMSRCRVSTCRSCTGELLQCSGWGCLVLGCLGIAYQVVADSFICKEIVSAVLTALIV